MAKKTTKTSEEQKGGGGALLLSMALGAALAAGAGYYATHKEDVDKEAKKRIDELAKVYKETRAQIEPKVREVWGAVSKESVAKYMDLRGMILDAMEDERVQNAGVLMRENYESIVENVVQQAKKSGILDAKMQKKLEKIFKTDWEKVRETVMTGAEVASSMAKKGMKKARKEVKKTSKQVNAKRAVKKPVKKAKKTVKKAASKAKPAVKKTASKVKKTASKARKTAGAAKKSAKKAVKKATKKK